MNIFVKILSIFALLSLCSCANLFDSSNKITLGLSDETAECKVGDIIIIALESNPTTGYDWTPSSYNSSILKLEGRRFISSSKFMRKAKNLGSLNSDIEENTLVGAPGVTEISFLALQSGESEVKLEYVRPWEGKPINQAIFKVKVTEE